MHLGGHESFFKYFRMFPTTFEVLLRLVAPKIINLSEKREAVSHRNNRSRMRVLLLLDAADEADTRK